MSFSEFTKESIRMVSLVTCKSGIKNVQVGGFRTACDVFDSYKRRAKQEKRNQ
jgi:hypothetical protein